MKKDQYLEINSNVLIDGELYTVVNVIHNSIALIKSHTTGLKILLSLDKNEGYWYSTNIVRLNEGPIKFKRIL